MKIIYLNILYFVVSVLVFFCFCFFIFKVVSVDTVIGVGLLVLFFLFYFFGHKQIYSVLWNQSKNIFLFYAKLIYLVSTIKVYILVLTESYLKFLWYKFNGLSSSIFCLNFMDLKFDLLTFFNINRLYNIFLLKLIFIGYNYSKLYSIELLNNDNYINLNILLNLEYLNFLKNG